MPIRTHCFIRLILLAALWTTSARAEFTYEADVRPILKAHCFQCHGERGMVEGNLDLRLRRFMVQGGDSGPAIEPGDAEASLLVQRVAAGEMPPGDDQRLSGEEVAVLTQWVAAGAPTRRVEPESLESGPYFTHEERSWWSFQPVRRPPPPATHAPLSTPVDAFILAKLDEAGRAELAPPADRPTRIRRLYLDMLGLPPAPEEVRRFLEDTRPGAWQRLVDRVLASPRYGERWGRHWLDAAGYADSEGYTDEDPVRHHAWRYRDYVIRAFNQDKPYTEFVRQQLAGDELAAWPDAPLTPAVIESLTATGFLRMAPDGTVSAGIDAAVARNQVIADTLQIVGTTLLGMTIHCAQCHDHRYDPISQRDYYRLRAVLAPAMDWQRWRKPEQRLISLYTDEDRRRRDAIESEAGKVDAERQQKVDFYIEKTLEHELLMVADELQGPLRAAFRAEPAKRDDAQKKLLEAHGNIANIREGSLYLYDRRREARARDLLRRREERLAGALERVRGTALAGLDEAGRREVLAAFEVPPAERSERQQQLVDARPAAGVTEDTLGPFDMEAAADLERYATAAAEVRAFRIRDELQKLKERAEAVRGTIPKEHFLRVLTEQPPHLPETFVFHRGDHTQPGEPVRPGGLSVLDAPVWNARDNRLSSSSRRLQFARYLTGGAHPLVARALVNRVWAHHFGRGIVATTGDFGALGARPSHPLLLDWLAAEFVDAGWSIKRLHRVILLSRVYQQSAVGAADLVDADPDNRLWGRWPLRRLESEIVRDAVLDVAGKRILEMYGEPVPVMEDGVGQIVLGKENLDGERKPTNPIPLGGDAFRRSVYVQVRRTRPLGVLESFDVPDLAPNCTDRASSNVAPQSLMLMNSRFMVEMSRAMAERLGRERPGDVDGQLRRGWQLAFGRSPSDTEWAAARDFVQRQTEVLAASGDVEDAATTALATWCQALLGSNRFLYIE